MSIGTLYTINGLDTIGTISDSDSTLIYDASAELTKQTTMPLVKTYVRGTSGGVVNITASDDITAAEHAGRIITASAAAGMTLQLPAATGTGNVYDVHTITTVTSNDLIIDVNATPGTDTMIGNVMMLSDTATIGEHFKIGGTDDTITMNGSTKGGIVGDRITCTDIASGLWLVEAFLSATGSEATPMSAAVS
jgi:hypothetical protein